MAIILDLCGGTGAWSRPYKEAGYEVYVITQPQFDVTLAYFKDGHIVFWDTARKVPAMLKIPFEYISGILAAPVCTEFSIAKGAQPRDFHKGMETVEACMRIIWEVQKHTKLDFWALENPRGLLRRFLGRPSYIFEQWQFGGDKVKATDIWGYFNPPKPIVKQKPENMTVRYPNGNTNSVGWGKYKCPSEYADYINSLDGYIAKRAACRAITPKGFAEAFYRANKIKRS